MRLTHQIRAAYRLILGDLVSTQVIYCVLPASHWGILESWPVEHVCVYRLSSFPRYTPSVGHQRHLFIKQHKSRMQRERILLFLRITTAQFSVMPSHIARGLSVTSKLNTANERVSIMEKSESSTQ